MYLLDTHVLVWAITSPQRLPAPAQAAIRSREIKVSVISLWELIVKRRRATAAVQEPLPWWERHVTRTQTEVLPVRVPHLAALDQLAEIHGDPFDRMLVAQAIVEECTLVTADATLARYGVRVVWD